MVTIRDTGDIKVLIFLLHRYYGVGGPPKLPLLLLATERDPALYSKP